jgi:hypothetical protein
MRASALVILLLGGPSLAETAPAKPSTDPTRS